MQTQSLLGQQAKNRAKNSIGEKNATKKYGMPNRTACVQVSKSNEAEYRKDRSYMTNALV